MKLLLDQNLSRKLLPELKQLFPGSSHVCLLGLDTASDEEVWNYAKNHRFTIITQDSDFNERSLIFGFPPKVIWLRTGNISTENIKALSKRHHQEILRFDQDQSLNCLQIY